LELHNLLKRQIKRCFGALNSPKLEGLEQFTRLVNEAYLQFDSDRLMLERSLDQCSRDLLDADSVMRITFARIINSTSEGIFAFDRNLRYTVWNPGMERITSLTEKQISGKEVSAAAALFEGIGGEIFADTLAGKTTVCQERSYTIPETGRQGYFEGHLSPLHNEGGEIIGGLGILRDVTAQKRAQDLLRLQTEQMQVITDAMASFLQSGNWREPTEKVLRAAISQTGSEYGFIGVVVEGPALRILGHHGIVWDSVVNRDFYEAATAAYQKQGYLVFDNLDNLFGRVVTGGKAVLSNDPLTDSRSSHRMPPGHPPLRHFLGVPILKETEVIGVIGVGNRPGGYTLEEIKKIETLTRATCVLYDNYRRIEREAAIEAERKHTEAALQESEERFRQLAENINSVFFLTGSDGCSLIYISPACEEVWGRTLESLYKKSSSWMEGIHPDDRPRVEDLLEKNPKHFQTEYRIVRPDGSNRWIWTRSFPIFDQKGVVYRLAWIAEDISERKAAEEALQDSRETIRLLLDSTAEAIYGIDLYGNCTFCNPACIRMLGYRTAEDLLGQNMHALIHHSKADGSAYPVEECRIYQAFRSGEGTHVANEFLWRIDGSSFPAEYWSFPIRKNGVPIGAVVTFLDITEQKQISEALENEIKTLESFVYTVSHDLKAPVVSLHGIASVLKSKYSNDLNEKIQHYLDRILFNASYMEKLIMGLLELSRVGRKQHSGDRVDARVAIEEILKINREVLQANKVEVILQSPLPPFYLERTALIQLFQNLVTNAAKFMGDQPHPRIEIGGKSVQMGVEFFIKDNGIGIAPEYHEKIFDIFQRLQDVETEGTGVGLAIVRKIIKLHKGKVRVESQKGMGTTFFIWLPRTEPPPKASAE